MAVAWSYSQIRRSIEVLMSNVKAKLKQKFVPLEGNERSKFFKDLKSYVYVYCAIDEENRRIPIYIGKGKSDRCLSHLDKIDEGETKKDRDIKSLIEEEKLGIDILAYGLDDKTALLIESSCIDLMGIDNLTNRVRGQGDNVKRTPINELSNLLTEKTVSVSRKHSGVSILINKHYKPYFGDLELFEITRGIWSKKMVTISGESKYAYATFNDVVKEVYEIHSWVPAGTQEYFTRTLSTARLKFARWEFVGRKAPDEIRKLYNGRIIEKPRSYGDPFIKVGL
jgi:uncharacterized protein